MTLSFFKAGYFGTLVALGIFLLGSVKILFQL